VGAGYTAPVTPVSAVIITRNEERNLPDALDSVAFSDEIVVMDAGSTDHTCDVAHAAGARVIVNTPWPGFVAQRNMAVQAARHDWILALDADERVTPRLREELEALRETGFAAAGYRMPRVTFYLGRWIRATDWYPDRKLRLFDRRRARWEGGRVHESVATPGPLADLRGELEHYPYADVSQHLRRIDRYTSLWAEQALEDGRRAGLADLLLAAPGAFLRNYLLKGGFRLGRVGLIVSALNAHYAFTKWIKLHEAARSADAR